MAATPNAFNRVVDRLTESGAIVRHNTPGDAMGQCPAHDDNNPSLHIAKGNKGVVLTCHAGCALPDILTGLGLGEADLFDEPLINKGPTPLTRMRTVPAPVPVNEYIYHDEPGEPVMKVVRFHLVDAAGTVTGKTFRQMSWTGTGWAPRIGDLEPPLYKLPRVLEAVRSGEPVFVVEGEKDVESVLMHGATATCNPMGAGKWRPNHTAALKDGVVLVVADRDAPGYRHAEAVVRALEGVARFVGPMLPAEGFKDVTEHLEAGKTLSELVPVTLAYLTEATADPKTPTTVGITGRVRLTPASAFRPARVRWGWLNRMPVGELCLIPGREGVGKSLFLAWLAGMLTRGELPGDFQGQQRAVLYSASEDDWRYTITPRMLAAGANLDLVYRVDVIETDMRLGRLTLPSDIDALTEAARDVNAAALMLDPIVSLIDDAISVNQAGELRRALEPLRAAASECGVMIAALAHFNKSVDTDVLSKIPGARAWAEVARAAFGLAEDRDADTDDDGGEPVRRYVASQIKNNLGRLDLPHISYRIEETVIDTEDGPASVGRWVMAGESDLGVEDVLNRKPERRGRPDSESTRDVVAWVADAGRAVSVSEVCAAFPEMPAETVRQVLSRAKKKGTLSNPIYGHYAKGFSGNA
jgi:archaellum biogenesis ATPase FlaH